MGNLNLAFLAFLLIENQNDLKSYRSKLYETIDWSSNFISGNSNEDPLSF